MRFTTDSLPVPDFYFSQFLRHVVSEARRRSELPPLARLPSPRIGPSTIDAYQAVPAGLGDNSELGVADFDFSVAEDIFASEDWMSLLGGTSVDTAPRESSGTFPFHPQGECSLIGGFSLDTHSQLAALMRIADAAVLPPIEPPSSSQAEEFTLPYDPSDGDDIWALAQSSFWLH